MRTGPKIEQIEHAWWRKGRPNGYHQYLKKMKARAERRKAKLNPETIPTYGKYSGWE